MQTFNFPYHVQSTEYPESGTRVQLGNGYIFTSPPNGPDLRRFSLKFETMKYFVNEEATSTNVNTNSVGVGTVAGSPGTLPPGWSTSFYPGIIYHVVGSGYDENGEPYVDLRISGTNSGGGAVFPGWQFTPNATSPAAVTGQTWTASIGIKHIAGTSIAFSNHIFELNSAGTYVTSGSPPVGVVPTTVPRRISYTRTLSGGATTARAQHSIRTASLAAGASIDTTVRLILPQLEQSATASSPIWTTTVPVTRTFGSISTSISPLINMATLEKFYQDHKMYKSFIYPHPVYGNVEAKFYSPLKIPEGIVGGNGALKDFTIELVEIIQ